MLVLLQIFVRMYQRSVQIRRDHGHGLERMVVVTSNWPESSQHKNINP
ncbi:hypothetical protein M5D96_011580, partial [Drosophila gunungcola]